MIPRLFNVYQRMCQETFHKPLTCPNDSNWLYPYIEHDETLILKCPGCDYKMIPGLARYNELKIAVEFYYGEKFND